MHGCITIGIGIALSEPGLTDPNKHDKKKCPVVNGNGNVRSRNDFVFVPSTQVCTLQTSIKFKTNQMNQHIFNFHCSKSS